MRKILIILLVIVLSLSACGEYNFNFASTDEDNLLKLTKPTTVRDINGLWELSESYNLVEKSNSENTVVDKTNVFVTDSYFEYKNTKMLNPKLSAKYVRLSSLLNNKLIEKPAGFEVDQENVIVYKAQDERLVSQEFIKTDNDQLVFIDVNTIDVYNRIGDISAEQEIEKYESFLANLEESANNNVNKQFSVSFNFRRKNSGRGLELLDYDYLTYFISRTEDQTRPIVWTHNDLVIGKDTGLWTIEHDRNYHEESNIIMDRILANPSFAEAEAKVNQLQGNYARRIDYINDNYIAFTKINTLSDSVSENYEVLNLNQLAMNQPLKINAIGGNEANDTYDALYNENFSIIQNQYQLETLEISKDTSNIGLVRAQMLWDFISSIEVKLPPSNNIVRRKLSLPIVPIIDIAAIDNKNIGWRDVSTRVIGAIDASVSPDGSFIMIQSQTQIEIYPMYNSFISLTPIVSIQNAEDLELVGAKWYPESDRATITTEFEKLPRLNTQVLYP